jgi:hypothetical protein
VHDKQPLEPVDALPQLIQLGECVSRRARDLSRMDVAAWWGHNHVHLATSRPPLPAVAVVHPVRLESQLAETLAAAWVSPGVVSVDGIAQEGVLPVEVGVLVRPVWLMPAPACAPRERPSCCRPAPREAASIFKEPLLHKRNQVIHALGIATGRVCATQPHGCRAIG